MKHKSQVNREKVNLTNFDWNRCCIFVSFSRNLKKWKKILCTVVVKTEKIGYTRVTDFLGCSTALSF